MCYLCEQIDRMDAADRLRIDQAIDYILCGGVAVERAKKKEKNPLVNRDLVAMEVALADQLQRIAKLKSSEAEKIIAAFLDSDFEVTGAAAKALVELVEEHFPKIGAAIAESAVPVTEETAGGIISLARKYIGKRPGFDLPADWTMTWELRDAKALEGLARKPALWIGNYYEGPMIEQARGVIGKAMEAGLGRDQTAALLKEGLGAAFENYRYWDVVASSVSTRARTWACLSSMKEAGFETFRVLAVSDERTCETCLLMDGREFSVAKSISTMESTFGLEDPEAVKETTPWLGWDKEHKDAYYMKGGRANYIGERGSESLQNSGIGMPPFHGRCYSDDTEVYTSRGWMLFKELEGDEKILSISPETMRIEWLPFVRFIAYQHVGPMYHLHSRWFDLLATPDHDQIYGLRDDYSDRSRITWRIAPLREVARRREFMIPRTAQWSGDDSSVVNINSLAIPAEAFCRFMAYWLSDGCVTLRRGRTYQIAIAKTDPKKSEMVAGLRGMPVKVDIGKEKIYLFSAQLGKYLMQFGKSAEKYIPDEIKMLSSRLIRIFLEAYSIGDGSIRRTFWKEKGIRSEGRVYYTTSRRLADDLGELILKVGGHPSFRIERTKGKRQEFKNGTYTINEDLIVVSWCKSRTAHKQWSGSGIKVDEVTYDGMVYDVELPRNHVLWVRRNGKTCFSGNCRCQVIVAD